MTSTGELPVLAAAGYQRVGAMVREELLTRLLAARRDTADAWMRLRGIQEVKISLNTTGQEAGAALPLWARTAVTATELRAHDAYTAAVGAELAARSALSIADGTAL